MKETKAQYLYGKLTNLSAAMISAGLAGGAAELKINLYRVTIEKHLSLDTWTEINNVLKDASVVGNDVNHLSGVLQYFNDQYKIANAVISPEPYPA